MITSIGIIAMIAIIIPVAVSMKLQNKSSNSTKIEVGVSETEIQTIPFTENDNYEELTEKIGNSSWHDNNSDHSRQKDLAPPIHRQIARIRLNQVTLRRSSTRQPRRSGR